MLALLCSARATLCSRRKRGEKGEVVETIEDVIVRRLTAERIEELKKLLRDTQEQYRCVHVLEREPALHILGIGRFYIQPHCVCVCVFPSMTGSWKKRWIWFRRVTWMPSWRTCGQTSHSTTPVTFTQTKLMYLLQTVILIYCPYPEGEAHAILLLQLSQHWCCKKKKKKVFLLSCFFFFFSYQEEEAGWRRSRAKEESHRGGLPRQVLKEILFHFSILTEKMSKILPVCCFFVCLRHMMSISIYLWAAAATFWMIPNTFDNWMCLLSTTTARQAMKNTPKRLPSVTVRSPLGANSPTVDPQADSSVPTPPMETGAVSSEETTTHSVVRLSAKLKRFELLHRAKPLGI